MVYVYGRYIKTGKEDCMKVCDTWESAIEHIVLCYNTDKKIYQFGEYYYFAKEH